MSASLLAILLCVSAVHAEFTFDSWTTNDGLPQNSVRGIAQTPEGYLWITTLDGLVRYDGVRFTVFNKLNTPGLISNRLFHLAVAGDGSIWFTTDKSDLMIMRDGKIASVAAANVPDRAVFGFETDASGEVFVVTPSGHYAYREDRFHLIRTVKDGDADLYHSRSGATWTVGRDRAVEVRNGVSHEFGIATRGSSLSAFEDSRRSLWLGDIGKLIRIDAEGVKYFSDEAVLPATTRPHRCWEETDTSIWCATGDFNLSGVGLIRLKDGVISRYGAESGLSNDRILAIFRDREGSVWIGTDNGLNRLRPRIVTPITARDGLPNDVIYPILKSRDGSVYIGSNGGLSRYLDGRIANINFHSLQDPLSPVLVQSLAEDDAGRVWIGAIGGLFLLENGRVEDISAVFDSNPTAWAIHCLPNGRTLIGTEYHGLFEFNGRSIVRRFTTHEGLPSNDVKVIAPTGDGGFWLGTGSGLARLQDGSIETYSDRPGAPDGAIRTIKKDADGTLWLGTYESGILRYRDDKFVNFSTTAGLFSNGAFAIAEDASGRFWVSSNQGIYLVRRSDLEDHAAGRLEKVTSVGIGLADGMANIECNGGRQPSSMVDDAGRIWFPTMGGVAVVDPARLGENLLPPPVEIESVEVDRKPVSTRTGLTLEPSAVQLDINYTAPSFIRPSQMRFRYMLDGIDNDWTDAGDRRSVSYSRLPPGDYIFRVIAANSDGVWNSEGRSLAFSVAAPFYRTWWFLALVILAAIFVAYLFYDLRVKGLKLRTAQQEAFSRQLIESQELERKRLAQELHDGLGQSLLIIKNRAALGLQASDRPGSDGQLNEIAEVVSDALSDVRNIAHGLRPIHLERLGLTSTLEEMVEQLDEAFDTEISYDIDNVDGVLSAGNEINLFRIVQESLNNVVKHSGATNAGVIVRRTAAELRLSIRDNGVGFDLDNAKDRGLGLNGIAERTRLLSGILFIESGADAGTTIEVTIPLNTDQ